MTDRRKLLNAIVPKKKEQKNYSACRNSIVSRLYFTRHALHFISPNFNIDFHVTRSFPMTMTTIMTKWRHVNRGAIIEPPRRKTAPSRREKIYRAVPFKFSHVNEPNGLLGGFCEAITVSRWPRRPGENCSYVNRGLYRLVTRRRQLLRIILPINPLDHR